MERGSGASSNLVGKVNARIRENCAAIPKSTSLPHPVAERIGPEQRAVLHVRGGVQLSEPGYELLLASIRASLGHRPIRRGLAATETARR